MFETIKSLKLNPEEQWSIWASNPELTTADDVVKTYKWGKR